MSASTATKPLTIAEALRGSSQTWGSTCVCTSVHSYVAGNLIVVLAPSGDAALAEQNNPVHVQRRDDRCFPFHFLHVPEEEVFHCRANPHHQVSLIDSVYVGRPERIQVGRDTPLHEQVGVPTPSITPDTREWSGLIVTTTRGAAWTGPAKADNTRIAANPFIPPTREHFR